MESQENGLFDGLYGLTPNNKAAEKYVCPEHAKFYHISPVDFHFSIQKISVTLNKIE